jgi:homoserine O-acetyltransferase
MDKDATEAARTRGEAAFAQDGGTLRFGLDRPLRLDSGASLSGVEIAYRTYGTLNAERSNAVLICHALTGDQHVAGAHPVTGKPGWWAQMVGPGKPLDPARHFIVCSNVLGGCSGSTGPSSINPETGQPWGLAFPVITIADMVRAQAMLVDALGIDTLFAVVGGSMGGMQVLQWAADYPERMFSAVCIASAARHSAQNIAFHEVGRQAVMADPEWRAGAYGGAGGRPEKGLAVARMAAHITYLSEAALQRKFGRELQRDGLSWGFDADFQVESYLRHQGATFVDRFDANSYLYITRAMDYFDLAGGYDGLLAEAFRKARDVRFCVLSFTSDWLYPTPESRAVVRALNAAGARVSFVEIDSDKGHDAFLLDEPVMRSAVAGFLGAAGQARGLT